MGDFGREEIASSPARRFRDAASKFAALAVFVDIAADWQAPIQLKQTYQGIVDRRLKARRCPRQHRRRPRPPPTAPIGPTAKALRPPTSRSLASRLRGAIRPPGSIVASARLTQPNLHRLYGAGEASIVQVVATSYRARISTARTCSKAASPRRHRQVESKEVIVGSPGGPSRRRTLSPRGATQSRSFDRRHRGRLRPPVRDRSAGRHGGSPSKYSACTCPMSARHIALQPAPGASCKNYLI
jgi:hypothetical protein